MGRGEVAVVLLERADGFTELAGVGSARTYVCAGFGGEA